MAQLAEVRQARARGAVVARIKRSESGKRLAHKAILCEVRVFLFRVERQLDDWPEKSARETRWFDAEEAAELVEEGGLAEIIKGFAGSRVRFVAYEKPSRPAPVPTALRNLAD